MSINISATFENGVFRPTQPLAMANGTAVRLTVDETLLPKTNGDAEVDAFIKSLQDAKDQDPIQSDYDFPEALNKNRSAGEAPLFPINSTT